MRLFPELLKSWRLRVSVVLVALAVAATWFARVPDIGEGEVEKDRHDSPGEIMEWRLGSLRDENGNIPADGLMRARAHVNRMRAARNAAAAAGRDVTTAGIAPGDWTAIGPGNIGGRVRAIAIHPTSTNIIFAGSVSGGIWKTTNGGTSWSVVDDFMGNIAITSIIFQPGDPSTMYAGTGEGFFNVDAVRGAGIFKSTDGGTTWAQLATTANTDFLFVNRLAVSADGAILLAGTRTGLWRSVNAGATWTRMLILSSQADAVDVKFLPGSSTHGVATGPRRNAYYTTDGGLTWPKSASFTDTTSGRIEIGVSASVPTNVYVVLETGNGQVWKSTDGGVTYAQVSTPAHLSGQGWYNNTIWVDPTNDSTVVIGGLDLHRSIDGGATFTQISTWFLWPNSAHADHHAIVHDPGYDGVTNRRVYFGNDGGVYKAENVLTVTSASFGGFTELNNTLAVTQFYGIGGNAATGKIIGGTQDNGTLLYTPANGSEGWTTEFGGDGGWSAADPADPNYFYGEYVRLRLHRSANGGASASYIYGGTNGTPSGIGDCKAAPFRIDDACVGFAQFIAPFIMDPTVPERLYAGGRSLWRTDDAKAPLTATTGPTWTAIKPPTTGTFPNSNITSIAVAATNDNVIWVGHVSGEIYSTTDGLSATPTWTKVSAAPLPTSRQALRIAIDPVNTDVVYATFGGYSFPNVFKTTNAGGSWSAIAGSGGGMLPAVPMRTIVLHPSNSNWLYLGTEAGIFTSEDGGATWSLPHDGPANVSVDELMWLGTTLVAGTHGRGVFTVDIPTADSPPSIVFQPQSQTIAPGQSAGLVVGVIGSAPLTYQWYQGTSPNTANPVGGATDAFFLTPPLAATTSYWVRATNTFGTADSSTATITVDAGQAIYDGTLKAPKCAVVGSSCDTGASLINGRANITAGPEPNQPNTINNACFDGTLGSYHVEESVDRLKVSTVDGTPFAPGKTVRIDVTVWASMTVFASDRVDLYGAPNANNPAWTFIATLTPTAGGVQVLTNSSYVLPAGGLQAVRANFRFGGSVSSCSTGSRDDHDDLIFAVNAAAGSEMVQNGNFAGGLTNWFLHEVPDIVHNSASNGVFQYHKANPTTLSGQAVIFQNTGVSVGSGTGLTAQFQVGNTDTVRKRISVLIIDADFSDLSVCTFWLAPSVPLATYQMKTHPTKNWANAAIYFYAASGNATGDYLLDNVSMQVDGTASGTRTDCIDPARPTPPGGAAGPNLLGNGDFSSPTLPPWGPFFDITHQLTGGVFEFIRPGTPGVPAGGIIQATGQAMTSGQIMTATFQLGNSSSVRKRVTVLLHEHDFSDLSACTFWIPPGAALSNFAMRTYATKAWTDTRFSIYAASTGPDQWTRLDNVTLARTPNPGVFLGTECFEPGSAPAPHFDPGGVAPEWRPGLQTRRAEIAGGFSPTSDGSGSGGTVWRAEATTTGLSTLGWANPIDLTGATSATLSFDSWLSGDSGAAVQVSLDGVTWHTIATVAPSDGWTTVGLNLDAFAGQQIYVRFVFDAIAPAIGVEQDVWRLGGIVVHR